jgi:hypothetical protein
LETSHVKTLVAVSAVVALTLFAVSATAQTPIKSNTQTIALNAVLQEAITIDAPSVAVVNFAIVGSPFSTSVTDGDATPTFNTNYSLKSGRVLSVCAYLAAPLVGSTSGNTDTISANGVLAQFNGTGGYVAFGGGSACGATNSLLVDTFTTTPTVHSAVRNNKIALQIGVLGGKTPDTYTGTLNIIAQAI